MNKKSIRWLLPLSYAGIALLAALSLGSLMLLVLNGYYARQEREYLLGNAQALKFLVEDALKGILPAQSLQDGAAGLAFFSQTRVRVLDGEGDVILDTGSPDASQMVLVSGGMTESMVVSFTGSDTIENGVASLEAASADVVIDELCPANLETVITPAEATTLQVGVSPYGYFFSSPPIGEDTVPFSTRRSSQRVSLELGDGLGTLEISEGPAYGEEIVRAVSLAWAGASGVAVLLAILAGWAASHQVTRPVLALIGATQRMEGGDLSVRVEMPEKQAAREFQALAKAFNGMAERVEGTVTTLRAFAADATHELKTPLTALHTNLELAADEQDAAKGRLYLAAAQDQNLRLEKLVSGLLDLSRIEAAGKADMAILALNPLVQEVGGQFARHAEEGGRTFKLVIPAETVTVRAGENQVRQVLVNLLDNALKFTAPGDTISVHLETEGGQAVLFVQDSGMGIPVEDMPHLFERFHRGRNAARHPGSGLGLAIVKALVESLGGRVEAESEAGGGACLRVRLPLAGEER